MTDLELPLNMRNLTKLVGKTMAQKVEKTVEHYEETTEVTPFSLKDLSEDEQKQITDAVILYHRRRNERKTVSIH